MTTSLGSAFAPKSTVEPDPDAEADRALLAAMRELTDKVANLAIPAPQVTVPAPQVRVEVPPQPAAPTADEIAAAIARTLPPDDNTELLVAVTSVKDAVDKLAKKQTAPRFGTGGGLAGAAFDSAGNLKVVTSTTGASATSVTINDPTVTTQKLAIDASGRVTVVQSGPVAVTGTFYQATQPVSATALPLPTGAATSAAQTDGTQKTQVTNFPVTQAVSLATNTPDVTDRAGRQLGHVTIDNATLTTADSRLPSALNGDGGLPTHVQNFPATQAVSAASLPLPTGAAQDGTDITTPFAMPTGGVGIRGWLSAIWTKLNGTVAVSLATNTPILGAGTNTVGNLNEIRAATSYATVVSSAVSLGATLTLAAPGAGLSHYITSIEIVNYTGIARTGAATPVTVTTTNITGNPAYTFATAAAIGTTDIQRPIMATPLKVAAANTATTIVAPVTTGSFWRINVTYFVGA